MAASNPPQVRNSLLPLPKGAGLGLDLNVDFLKKYMAEGETWWG
jgi:L-alanine-DL-glutamate epimerase-like enolase superfamily enzyme